MATSISVPELLTIASKHGLIAVAVTDVAALDSRVEQRFAQAVAEGRLGELDYLTAERPARFDPAQLLPGAKSIVIFAAPYFGGEFPAPPATPAGRVARYAWGRDYHKVLPKILKRLIAEIPEATSAKTFADATPLLERPLAERGGLGFTGKNSLIITPGVGSMFLLCGLIWNVEIDIAPRGKGLLAVVPEQVREVAQGGCGSCQSCLDLCPTKAFVAPYKLDVRRCISYLTIELRRGFTAEERCMVGDWIFGCDRCQEVCPHNHRNQVRNNIPAIAEFGTPHGAGAWLSLEGVLSLRTHEQFVQRFAGTPLMRAKREGLLRNACAVAGNLQAVEMLPLLKEVALVDDSAMVREQAQQAVFSLS